MILYTEDTKDSTKKLLALINEFRKVSGYKFNIQKSVASLYTNKKLTERVIKKTMVFTIASKRIKIHRYKCNQRCKRLVLGKLYDTEERN